MFDKYLKDLVYDDKNYKLEIHDMGGQPDLKDTRFVAYPGTDVILLCFRRNS